MNKPHRPDLVEILTERQLKSKHNQDCADLCLQLSNARIAMNSDKITELLDKVDAVIRHRIQELENYGR